MEYMVPEGALRILEEVAMGKKDKEKKKKKRKEEEEEKQDNSGNGTAGTYADGHPLDEIQYLEAKLILKPDRFTSVESFRDFGKLVKKNRKERRGGLRSGCGGRFASQYPRDNLHGYAGLPFV
jgi:hypothetical protein